MHTSTSTVALLTALLLPTLTSAQLSPIVNSTNTWTLTSWSASCATAATSPCTYTFSISAPAHPSASIPPFSALCSTSSARPDDPLAACELLSPSSAQNERVSARLLSELPPGTDTTDGDYEPALAEEDYEGGILQVSVAFEDVEIPFTWTYNGYANPPFNLDDADAPAEYDFSMYPYEVWLA